MDELPTNGVEGDGVDEFVRARFHGGRFAAHAIPFDFLDDLALYRDLIVELAKRIYLADHPNRVRVPKGFVESFGLGLVGVVPGNSATAVAKWIDNSPSESPRTDMQLGAFSEFNRARDLVDQVLRSAANDEPLPIEFPRELAKRFNALGRGLKEAEQIDFYRPGESVPAPLTKATRKRIILSAAALYEDPIDLKLQITGVDFKTGRIFTYSRECERAFELKGQPEDRVRRAHENVHQVARVCGLGQFDHNDNLQQITENADLLYLGDEPSASLSEQLDGLRSTPSGWYVQDTPAPSQWAIDKLGGFLDELVSDLQQPTPFLYPTPSGGVTAEWTDRDWSISASLEPEGEIILHALNTSTDSEREAKISTSSGTQWNEAVSFLASLFRGRGSNAD